MNQPIKAIYPVNYSDRLEWNCWLTEKSTAQLTNEDMAHLKEILDAAVKSICKVYELEINK